MSSVTMGGITPQYSFEANVHTQNKSLVEQIRDVFLTPEEKGKATLHDRAVHLPFFKRLVVTKNITKEELLLNNVNDSAIFEKFETVVKSHLAFKDIFPTAFFFQKEIEKDIKFFMEKFNLSRPPITWETQNYLKFIEKTIAEDKNFLAILLYIQYAGLFVGRQISQATENWLAHHIENWKTLPEKDRGVAFWHFEGRSPEELESAKKEFLNKINSFQPFLTDLEKVKKIARETFAHTIACVESSSSKYQIKISAKICGNSKVHRIGLLCLVGITLAMILNGYFYKQVGF